MESAGSGDGNGLFLVLWSLHTDNTLSLDRYATRSSLRNHIKRALEPLRVCGRWYVGRDLKCLPLT